MSDELVTSPRADPNARSPERDARTKAPRSRLDNLSRDRLLITVVFLAAWEGLLRFEVVSPFFLASPSQIVGAMIELSALPEVRTAFFGTLTMVATAFAIATVAGVTIGAWLGLSDWAYRAFHPIAVLGMSTPKMIFLPLFIVMFGIGYTAKVSYGILSALFFIIINVTAGVRMVDPKLLGVVRSLGATRVQGFRFVILPGSLPGVIVGMWYGIKHALLGVLIAELFISVQGIGFFITRYTSSLQVDRVYAIVTALAMIAISLGWFWQRVDQRMNRWRGSAD